MLFIVHRWLVLAFSLVTSPHLQTKNLTGDCRRIADFTS
uniref:Uncharacterized protein n=1 Tax=Arundo donax TaxID=35708 RepID=A0A0A9G7Y4_ARUDO